MAAKQIYAHVTRSNRPAAIAIPKTGTHKSFLIGLGWNDNNLGQQPATIHEKQLLEEKSKESKNPWLAQSMTDLSPVKSW